jgi:hypothetical protein
MDPWMAAAAAATQSAQFNPFSNFMTNPYTQFFPGLQPLVNTNTNPNQNTLSARHQYPNTSSVQNVALQTQATGSQYTSNSYSPSMTSCGRSETKNDYSNSLKPKNKDCSSSDTISVSKAKQANE